MSRMGALDPALDEEPPGHAAFSRCAQWQTVEKRRSEQSCTKGVCRAPPPYHPPLSLRASSSTPRGRSIHARLGRHPSVRDADWITLAHAWRSGSAARARVTDVPRPTQSSDARLARRSQPGERSSARASARHDDVVVEAHGRQEHGGARRGQCLREFGYGKPAPPAVPPARWAALRTSLARSSS